MRRLFPRTAFVRNTRVILLVVLVSQLLSFLFVLVSFYRPALSQYARLAVLQLQLAENAREAPIGQGIAEATGIQAISLPGFQPPAVDGAWVDFLNESVARLIRDETGEIVDARLSYEDATPVFWVRKAGLDGIWVQVPLEFLRYYDRYLLWGWLVLFPIITVVAAMLIGVQLNRPLKQLANVARQLGVGEFVPALDDQSNLQEINEVNRAFNRLALDINQAQKDRALLLAGVSHDLRTPLTRLRLTAEFIEDAETREGIIRDIEDMDAILGQFINFIRDGRDETPEFGELTPLIEETVAAFSDVDIQLESSPLPEMYFKRLAMKRLLTNLLTNASRYGRGEIQVRSHCDGKDVVIEVLDNGPGMAEADIDSLMQPFFRGDKARTTQGSGLGLAIAKRIVELHHGSLQLENREGGGLVARVRLPVAGELLQPESLSKRVR